MATPDIARIGVTAGWFLFGASLLPILWRSRTGSQKRSPVSLAAMALQALGFAIVWGWNPAPGRPLFAAPRGLEPLIAVAAVVLAIASGLFGVWAVRTLGRQWSLVARLTDQHQLITTGPYAIVRHPIYTAMSGLLLATGMARSEFIATVIAAAIYTAATMIRVGSEERLLASAFGPAHVAYQRRVRAFIPGVW
ncbi:MAG: isoprenylcysteine carboxylmethyltransferase family protein [Vicinamibacterales bacterium]